MYLLNPKKNFEKIDNDSYFIPDYRWGLEQFNDGIYEYSLIQWCKENFCKDKNKNFLDIGSYIGQWSWLIADNVNTVYAFEPNIEVYNCLCANIHLKNLSHKIKTFNFGLSSENIDDAVYYSRKNHLQGSSGFEYLGLDDDNENITKKYFFPLRRLDDLNLKDIGFIKIDVEGYEKNVLVGAQDTLKNSGYPPIILESWDNSKELNGIYPSIKLRKELFDYIINMGYNLYSVKNYNEMFLCIKE